jgi:transcriptional regulator with XRE-family HTH domain
MTEKASNEGARQLWIQLARRQMSSAELARRCGVNRSTVSRLLSGEFLPDRELSLAIQKEVGTAPEAWSKPPRKS